VADGIYYATSSGTMNVGANSPIILTDSEAIVIDSELRRPPRVSAGDRYESHHRQAREVKMIDSDYHYDHARQSCSWPTRIVRPRYPC
jgi:hypothetical protein